MTLSDALQAANAIGFETAAPLNVSTLQANAEVRQMCAENKCSLYGSSWACPPACGTLEECQKRMTEFTDGILVQSVGALEDSWDYEGMKALEDNHKKRFFDLVARLRGNGMEVLPLSAGTCTVCARCAYPEPCRMPERVLSSMEAYGLLVSQICTDNGVKYYHGKDTLAYTSCILLNKKPAEPPVLEEIATHAIEGMTGSLLRSIREALAQDIPPAEVAMAMTRHFLTEDTAKSIEEQDLSRLLLGARATSRGMEILRPHLLKNADYYRYTAVIGTAAGDLHDLGKNLVACMLEVAGFRVVDLGIDVSADDFIRALDADDTIRLVGISCLLSTSLPSVVKITDRLRQHPARGRFRISIGGGATNPQFAAQAKADVYTRTAVDAACYARELLKQLK